MNVPTLVNRIPVSFKVASVFELKTVLIRLCETCWGVKSVSKAPDADVCTLIKLSVLFRAVTRFWAAVSNTVEVVALVALGAKVTTCPTVVIPDTVMVNPGKSARLEKVFEVEVCVTGGAGGAPFFS